MRLRPRLPTGRRGRVGLAAILALVLGWAAAAFVVIIDPVVNRPAHADAIVVLGGVGVDARLTEGVRLAREGYAPVLLLSAPNGSRYYCHRSIPRVRVECFDPNPTTTQGEAREIGAQASAHGWRTVIVVTSRYHISRARLIVGRCFSGRVLMVDAARPPSLGEWAYNLLYQTAAYAKALVHSAC